MDSNAEKLFLSIKEVALQLGVHRNTVEKWLKSGKVKGRKFGKLWRIKKTDLGIE